MVEPRKNRTGWFVLRVVVYVAVLLVLRLAGYWLALSLIGNYDPLAPWYAGVVLLGSPVVLGGVIHGIEGRRGNPHPRRRRWTVAVFTVLALPIPYELLVYAAVGPDRPILDLD